MQVRNNKVGVIYLDNRISFAETVVREDVQEHFSDEQLKLLIAIGHQAALAVEHTRFYHTMVQAKSLVAVGQTIATLSHHIKNILQGMKGGSHLIEMGLEDHKEEHVRRGWSIVNKNQNRIYNLVMDMLSYSKEREPVLENADLNRLVGEVVELLEPRAEEVGVQLNWVHDNRMPRMAIDSEGIHRAVLNVVSNALDATEEREKGRVEVETLYVSSSDRACVRVRDNGVGISPMDLPNVFRLFASTKGARGTGLGLAVSEKIVREHGGHIRVQSNHGKGTEFTIELPIQKRTTAGNPTLTIPFP